jgi:[ribosomal protein S5]-alanine N-acetyltransferase
MNEQWRTERLLARTPTAADALDYRDLFLDPAVADWLRPTPDRPLGEVEILGMLKADERHWEEHGFGPWVLVEQDGGAVVGRGGLRWTELGAGWVVELPWVVASQHWNRGFATEAAAAAVRWAGTLGMAEVVALIVAANVASRRVAEKAGLRVEGEAEHAGLPHLVYRGRPASLQL